MPNKTRDTVKNQSNDLTAEKQRMLTNKNGKDRRHVTGKSDLLLEKEYTGSFTGVE